jgi:hypothetical protein
MSTPIVNAPPAVAAPARLIELAPQPASACACGCGDSQEMNAGLCPIPKLAFPRFFAGELVQPDDLNAIEKRIFSHEQLRARHTIGWGIACGFRVGIDGQATVGTQQNEGVALATATLRVESGYGIDRYGRDVYMADDFTIPLAQLFAERAARIQQAMGDPWCAIPGCQPTPPTHYCIAVRYKECLDKPVPSYAQQCGTPKTICEYSRVCEGVEIRVFGDNEFPTIPTSTDTQTWCGLPSSELTMANLWALITSIPHGATDVASTVAQSAAAEAAGTSPNAAFTNLAGQISGDIIVRQPSCDDLLHLARPCDPCLAWPWIPLACFTSDGTTVGAPDCRVRRTIYSLQEIEAAVVRLFCILLDERTQRTNATAAAPAAGATAAKTATKAKAAT